MPVFTDALIGDTTHLDMAEFGSYCMILFVTWRNNGTPLPDDDARMARICRMSLSQWKKARPTLATFFDLSDGVWRQNRLEKTWKKTQESIQSQRDKAEKRWKGEKTNKPLKSRKTPDAAADAAGHPKADAAADAAGNATKTITIIDDSDANASSSSVRDADAKKPAPAANGKPWLRIIAAFDEIIVEVWGPERKRLNPSGTDGLVASRWHQAGIDHQDIRPWFLAKMASAHRRGKEPPRSLSAYDDDIPNLLAEKSRSIPKASSLAPSAGDSEYTKSEEFFKKMGAL